MAILVNGRVRRVRWVNGFSFLTFLQLKPFIFSKPENKFNIRPKIYFKISRNKKNRELVLIIGI
jgi:hypothetical protein